jgi:4-hydroxy-tetrahydrodipicolinate reductase
MNVAIIGYGKMGKEVEAILQQMGHTISLRSDEKSPFKAEDLKGSDVAIEFTRPESAVDNIFKCFDANCPVVIGTTGWYMRMPEVRNECLSRNQSMLYATNFSIGVNVLFHLNKELARIMERFPEYQPDILEIHHAAKLDKPSGTAITLAEGILENIPRKARWVNEGSESDDVLSIISEREGEVPGTHIINYKSDVDNISLTHQAVNRRGFALGAVKAAEWLVGKKGCYSIHDFLKF